MPTTDGKVRSGGGTRPATADPLTPTPSTTYRWRPSYSRDPHSSPTRRSSDLPGETSVVNQATPTLTTVATPTALVGGSISDTANLAGGFGTLGGTIT